MATPIAGQLERIFPNVHRLCAPNPGPMTGPGTNTYFYGDAELAVFDPGPALEPHINAILQAQDTLATPITRLFASHTHADHSPAVAVLAKHLPQAEIIGIQAAPDQLFEDHSFQPHIQPKDNQLFSLPSGLVRAIHTPGHVSNHVCYLIEEHRFLTTGDHLMNGSTVVIIPPKGSMSDYIFSLEKLLDYSITSMGPGHGGVIDNPQEVLKWTIKHRLQREEKVVANLLIGKSCTLTELVVSVYDDVDSSLHGIAQMSLHAHLIKLQEEGRAEENDQRWRLVT